MKSKGLFLYPTNFDEITDLRSVCEMIAVHCASEPAKSMATHPQFLTSAEQINKAHQPVKEAMILIESGISLPVLEFYDNRDIVIHLRTQGWVIDVEQLQTLKILFQCYQSLHEFLSSHQAAIALAEKAESVVFHKHLLQLTEKILDTDGTIRDDASEELVRLKKEHLKYSKDIEKRLLSIFKEMKNSGITGEDSNLTIRNGRSVIPVPANYKYRVKGIIHDESATGQTAYIEPLEIVEMGNKLREIQAARQREIQRILSEISAELHVYVDDILQYYDVLAFSDFCFAKARFAMKFHAVIPEVSNSPLIEWKLARNIVLQHHLESRGTKIIPLSISLGDENRLLVLSGANAGGKSVVIKTVALLQSMIQCGFPVPFEEHSKAGVFSSILLDIGDGQSIESSLSTYSSHLETMKIFISKSNSKTLYLIDEIGTGTDPILGGSLAQAILLYLHSSNATGIVTTHLDILKKMADETPGAGNAAMAFDKEKLEPSYIFSAGIPGHSFTFEIAARTGIPQKIIEDAKTFAGTDRITFEQKISDVEKQSANLSESLKKQKMAETFLDELIDKYTSLIQQIERKQSEIIEKTKQEALEIFEKTNKTIENTIRKIRESSADKEITKQSREEVKQAEQMVRDFNPSQRIPDRLKKKIPPEKPELETPIKNTELFVGMKIRHKTNGMEGTIVEYLNNDRIKVAFNSIAITLSGDMITPLTEQKKQNQKQHIKLKESLHQKTELFSRQLDLRGFKAEDVLSVLEKHIDDALLIGIYQFSVIHGKGYGVLRNVVRQLLAKHPNVDGFESEHIEHGGDGITVVRLKK